MEVSTFKRFVLVSSVCYVHTTLYRMEDPQFNRPPIQKVSHIKQPCPTVQDLLVHQHYQKTSQLRYLHKVPISKTMYILFNRAHLYKERVNLGYLLKNKDLLDGTASLKGINQTSFCMRNNFWRQDSCPHCISSACGIWLLQKFKKWQHIHKNFPHIFKNLYIFRTKFYVE